MDKICVQYAGLYVPEVNEQMKNDLYKGTGVGIFQLKGCLNKKKSGGKIKRVGLWPHCQLMVLTGNNHIRLDSTGYSNVK